MVAPVTCQRPPVTGRFTPHRRDLTTCTTHSGVAFHHETHTSKHPSTRPGPSPTAANLPPLSYLPSDPQLKLKLLYPMSPFRKKPPQKTNHIKTLKLQTRFHYIWVSECEVAEENVFTVNVMSQCSSKGFSFEADDHSVCVNQKYILKSFLFFFSRNVNVLH